MTLEKSAYAAWKSKDAKFWDTFLSDKFVGWGRSGRLDKVSAKKEYTGADCKIKSYALSEERVSPPTQGRSATLRSRIALNSESGRHCGHRRELPRSRPIL